MPVRGGGRAPALPPATLPRQPAREYGGPARRRRNRGRGPPGPPGCREQVPCGAPHRIHEQCGAQAGLGWARTHGYGLACAAAVTFGPQNGRPSSDRTSPRCPPVEVIVTRRGVRQQHGMTARCGPRYKQEPLARELSDGERARGQLPRCFRRGNLAAEHQACRAAGGALAAAGAAPERPYRGPGCPPTERGQPVAGLPRQCGARLRPRRKGVEAFGRLGRKWPIAADPGGPGRGGPT